MKRVNKKRNNFNVMVIKKQAVIFRMGLFLSILLIIFYAALLFFNVQYAYALKNKEVKINQQQNLFSFLQSQYLSQINSLEENIETKKYSKLQSVVYLEGTSKEVAFQKSF